MSAPLQSCLVLILITLLGGALPLLAPRTDRWLHLLIALATGTFLGAVFLHLLPEIAHEATGAEGHDHGFAHPWAYVLAGVVSLFVLENLVLRPRRPSEAAASRSTHGQHEHGHHEHGHHEHHGHDLAASHHGEDEDHRLVSYASFFGLSIHALTAGIGLGAAAETSAVWGPLMVSFLGHKALEGFSLATVFALAGFTTRRLFLFLFVFSLATPLGLLLGTALSETLTGEGLEILTALAAGTFLFVALCDLLPEVFHRAEDGWAKVVLLVAGIALANLI